MIELLFLFIFIVIYGLYKHKKYEIVYEAKEDNLTESQHVYWLLKNEHLKPLYEIKNNLDNLYLFGKVKDSVVIKVNRKYAEEARKSIMFYRIEKRKMEENIRNEKEKIGKLFM